MGRCWSSPLDSPYVDSGAVAFQTTKSTQSSSGTSSNSRSSAPSGGYDSSSRSLAGNSTPAQYPRIFSFADLKVATKNFKSDFVLGEGGFGKVYKGWIDSKIGNSGSIVAVKKLRAESMQGFQEWQSEVNFLGKLSNAHLVTLIGYCCEDNELLLVYEFMQRGSLENHLFGRGAAVNPLPWETRLQILTGAARGLAFLHSLDRKVIYRDFKASNILLDGSYNAKISDFGLAKMGPSSSQSHVTTQIMGTHGYAAPEYIATGHLYVKSDVYGFGVVVVEMLTGLHALDLNRPLKQQNLIDWVKPHLSDRRKLMRIMDSHLEGKYPSRSAMQVAQLALSCLASEPQSRPSMQDIVNKLEKIASNNEKPGMQRVHIGNQQGRSNGDTTPRRQFNLPQRSPGQQVMNSPLPLPPKSY